MAGRLDRAGEIRAALGCPRALCREAERLLAAVPADCDVLAWSPEGYNIALVASVLAHEMGRSLTVHRASLVAPLAPPLRADPWVWVSAEELLGLGAPRTWATTWAAAQRGTPSRDSAISLALVQ
jgi:hypothetical protein